MSIKSSLDPVRLYSAIRLDAYLAREFKRVGAPRHRVRVHYTDVDQPPHDVCIERKGRSFTVIISRDTVRDYARFIRTKITAFAYWFSLCEPSVRSITVNVTDGHIVSDARFAASTRFAHTVALPDPHFFQHNGFACDAMRGHQAPDWSERSDQIIWRGEMNGAGWISFDPQDMTNEAVMQRLRMVMLLTHMPDVDARFVRLPKSELEFRNWARGLGLLGEPVPAQTWLNCKYAIDIDGFTNTWSNLLVRMLYGCCVLKVASQFGYRQWYYDELKPFEHFVPVRADMSDFAEKIDWVRSNPAQAKEIASNGQALARKLTFATQAQRAARLIHEHWARPRCDYAETLA